MAYKFPAVLNPQFQDQAVMTFVVIWAVVALLTGAVLYWMRPHIVERSDGTFDFLMFLVYTSLYSLGITGLIAFISVVMMVQRAILTESLGTTMVQTLAPSEMMSG